MKKLFFLVLFVYFALTGFSQDRKFSSDLNNLEIVLRHAKNMSSVFLNVGYLPQRYNLELGYSNYLTSSFLVDLSLQYLLNKQKKYTRAQSYLLDVSLNYKVFKFYKGRIFTHIGFGFNTGLQKMNCTINDKDKFQFIYAPELTLKNEIYVSDNFIINLNFIQTLYSNSDFEKQYYKVLFGVKYLIY